MSVRWEILLLILACMVVTFIPRILPMALAGRVVLPPWFLSWLHYVPVSVISAMFFPEVLLVSGDWRQWHDPYFLAAWPTLALALISRNIVISIIGGVISFTVLRLSG